MKFISALMFGMLAMSVSADAADPKFLDAHQAKTIKVSVPAGRSSILIGAAGKEFATPLSCAFYDSSGNVALKQKHVYLCSGNTPKLVRPETLSVQITNEADERVQYDAAVLPYNGD